MKNILSLYIVHTILSKPKWTARYQVWSANTLAARAKR